jgi:Ca2+-binding EF-hand superfamily protein
MDLGLFRLARTLQHQAQGACQIAAARKLLQDDSSYDAIELFRRVDRDQSGILSVANVKEFLRKHGTLITNDDATLLIRRYVPAGKRDEVLFADFLHAFATRQVTPRSLYESHSTAVPSSAERMLVHLFKTEIDVERNLKVMKDLLADEVNLRSLFARIDLQDSGVITREQVTSLLRANGIFLTEHETNQLFLLYTQHSNGSEISFRSFLGALLPDGPYERSSVADYIADVASSPPMSPRESTSARPASPQIQQQVPASPRSTPAPLHETETSLNATFARDYKVNDTASIASRPRSPRLQKPATTSNAAGRPATSAWSSNPYSSRPCSPVLYTPAERPAPYNATPAAAAAAAAASPVQSPRLDTTTTTLSIGGTEKDQPAHYVPYKYSGSASFTGVAQQPPMQVAAATRCIYPSAHGAGGRPSSPLYKTTASSYSHTWTESSKPEPFKCDVSAVYSPRREHLSSYASSPRQRPMSPVLSPTVGTTLYGSINKEDVAIASSVDQAMEACPAPYGLSLEQEVANLFFDEINAEREIEQLRRRLALHPSFSLIAAFNALDRKQTGFVSVNSIQRLLKKTGYYLSGHDARVLMRSFSPKRMDRINYSDFIRVLMPKDEVYSSLVSAADNHHKAKRALSKDSRDEFCAVLKRLSKIFDTLEKQRANVARRYDLHEVIFALDPDRSGKLSAREFQQFLLKHAIPASDGDVSALLSRYDGERHGSVAYNSFVQKLRPT